MGAPQMQMALGQRLGLSPPQRACMDAIERYVAEHRCAPSYEEIAALIGRKSKSAAYRLVGELKQRGYVTTALGKERSLEIVAHPATHGSRAFVLPSSVQATLDAHCRMTGEHPDSIVADAVALFLDQAEADPA